MSGKVMGRVWDLKLPAAQMLILLAMADHADHEGNNIYPSVGLVAWKTGYSDRQVQRIVKQLVDKGILLEQGQSERSTNMYSINLTAGETKEPYKTKRGVKMSPLVELSGDDKMSPQGCQNVTEGVTELCQGGGDITVSPESLINHQENQEHNHKDSPTPFGAGNDDPVVLTTKTVKPFAAMSEGEKIGAIIQAYLIGNKIPIPQTVRFDKKGKPVNDSPYNKPFNRRPALTLVENGITAQDLTDFIEEKRDDAFWESKEVSWSHIIKNIGLWKDTSDALQTPSSGYDIDDDEPVGSSPRTIPPEEVYTPTPEELAAWLGARDKIGRGGIK